MVTVITRELNLGFVPNLLPFGEGRALFFYSSKEEAIGVVERNMAFVESEMMCFNWWNRLGNAINTGVEFQRLDIS